MIARSSVPPRALALFLVLAGCGGPAAAVDASAPRDAAASDAPLAVDTGSPIDTGPVDTGPAVDTGVATATLSGMVTRSTGPQAGGIGGLYVAVFTEDPVTSSSSAVVVGRTVIEDADMSGSDAAIPYEITGIPPRADPYYVVAFLDDNMNASADAPAPDRGDLVTLMGFASPSVEISTATDVTLDLVLTTALPF